MKKSYLKKIYKYNETTRKFEIEISLDYYMEMFNEWDAAPLRKKDLDPELVDYLVNAGLDIPLKHDIDISFIMPKNKRNSEMEDITVKVFKNYFLFLIHLNRRQITRHYKRALTYMSLGFILLTTAFLAEASNRVTFDVLKEGLFIGGWVFLWETISLAFFKVNDLKMSNKRFKRFSDSQIKYKYH